MIHSIGWLTVTTTALLIREAGSLLRRGLAYRQQRWMIENVKQVTSEGQSVEIASLDRIIISRDPGQPE